MARKITTPFSALPAPCNLSPCACTSLIVKSRVLPTDTRISRFSNCIEKTVTLLSEGEGASEQEREGERCYFHPAAGKGNVADWTTASVRQNPQPRPWFSETLDPHLGSRYPAVTSTQRFQRRENRNTASGQAEPNIRTRATSRGPQTSTLHPEPSTLNTNPAS